MTKRPRAPPARARRSAPLAAEAAAASTELTQCDIYDGNQRDARLVGVEYVISARLFGELPDHEKWLWHSHVHEVRSGQLVAPGLPAIAEKALMKKLVGTYGKTRHLWHTTERPALSQGAPKLMMGLTADGQANAAWSANLTSVSASGRAWPAMRWTFRRWALQPHRAERDAATPSRRWPQWPG